MIFDSKLGLVFITNTMGLSQDFGIKKLRGRFSMLGEIFFLLTLKFYFYFYATLNGINFMKYLNKFKYCNSKLKLRTFLIFQKFESSQEMMFIGIIKAHMRD